MKVDMSPKAVTVRLKRVSQLRRLCLSLRKAQPAEPSVEPAAKPVSSHGDQPRNDAGSK
jgi:hypothetical protein